MGLYEDELILCSAYCSGDNYFIGSIIKMAAWSVLYVCTCFLLWDEKWSEKMQPKIYFFTLSLLEDTQSQHR